jgi:hypothetical protein
MVFSITSYVLGTVLHVPKFDLKAAVVTRIGVGGNIWTGHKINTK